MNKASEKKMERAFKDIAQTMHQECKQDGHWHHHTKTGAGGAVYGLGVLGALYYYLTTATSLWTGVIGIVKAILWPAFVVHAALKFLGA